MNDLDNFTLAPGPRLFSANELFATDAVSKAPQGFASELGRRVAVVALAATEGRHKVFSQHGLPPGLSSDEVGEALASKSDDSIDEITDKLEALSRQTLVSLVWELQAYALAAFKEAVENRYSSGQYPLNSPEAKAAEDFSEGLCFLMGQVMGDFFLIGSAEDGNRNTAETFDSKI